MRTAIAALAALSVLACSGEKPKPGLTFDKVERVSQYDGGAVPLHPAPGNEFAIVSLTEDPRPPERRVWLASVLEDWDGHSYDAKFAEMESSSQARGLFGRMVANPDRIRLVFEIPREATVRMVTVPHAIPLSTAARIEGPNAPKLIHHVPPLYPDAYLRAGITGEVKLEVMVTADGRVGGAKVVDDLHGFGEFAAAAVRQWRYQPAVVDGKPVPALTDVTINFRLGT